METNLAAPQPDLSSRRIPVVGIVGGIGSGKSAVANWVATQVRVAVLNADQLGHESLEDPEIKDALIQRFGQGILGADQKIERALLAREVFGTAASQQSARQELERIVHPGIERRIKAGIDAAAAAHQEVVLLDAAVLLEAGWKGRCDLLVYIDTPDAIRLARVLEHRGWTEDELRRRESSQWSLMDKRRECDLIVTNDRDLEYAGRQLLQSLQQRGWIRPLSPGQ